MKKWLKAYGLVIWYVLIETVTAAALAVAYVLKTGQTDTSCIEVFIADTVFITTIIAGFIVMTPFIPKLMKKKKESVMKKISWTKMLYIVSLGIVLDLLTVLTTNYLPFGKELQEYNNTLEIFNSANKRVALFATIIVTPVVEEFLFRYKAGEYFKDEKKSYRIIATAIVFGCTHVNVYQIVYGFVLGIIIGRVYEDNKNLLEPVILHGAINAATCVAYMAKGDGEVVCIGIVAIAIIYFCMYSWKAHIAARREKQRNERSVNA